MLSLPAMEALRAGYVELWTARPNVSLARFADRAYAIASTGLDTLGIIEPQPAVVERLAAFDSIISWYGANRPEFIDTVGSLGLAFQFLRALPPEDYPGHATDFYLEQAASLGAGPAGHMPRLVCPEVTHGSAVIHPFSGSRRKNWPLERFRELARHLEQHMPVRWCAGPEEALAEAVRFDDLYELACWLKGARVYIGNDSGISHLAAAAGAPSLVLFGPTDPRRWAPRGPNVHILATETPGQPIDAIPLEAVQALVYRITGDSQ